MCVVVEDSIFFLIYKRDEMQKHFWNYCINERQVQMEATLPDKKMNEHTEKLIFLFHFTLRVSVYNTGSLIIH